MTICKCFHLILDSNFYFNGWCYVMKRLFFIIIIFMLTFGSCDDVPGISQIDNSDKERKRELLTIEGIEKSFYSVYDGGNGKRIFTNIKERMPEEMNDIERTTYIIRAISTQPNLGPYGPNVALKLANKYDFLKEDPTFNRTIKQISPN